MPINKDNPFQQKMLKDGKTELEVLEFYYNYHKGINHSWHKKQAEIYKKDIEKIKQDASRSD